MHVAVLFEFPTLNGGERSLLAALTALRRQGVDVRFTAFAPSAGPLANALNEQGIRHVPWSVRDESGQRKPAHELEASLVRTIEEIRPDLVHANSLAMGRQLGRIAERSAIPATAHLRDIIGLSGAAIADLNRCRRLIAVSEATRAFHVAQRLDASRTIVIHNGVDLDEFAPRPPTGFLRHELCLPRSTRLMATIGQIGLRKGWHVLAAALTRIDHDLRWLLIGERHSDKDESRRYQTELRERIRSAGWESRVHWLGTRSDVSRILNEIDLLVHPAKQEPLGRVLLEALASGVPIVATDVGGTREIIESNVSGRLVPAGDPAELGAAISSVLSDEKLAESFRHAARRQAEEKFDIRDAALRLWNAWKVVA